MQDSQLNSLIDPEIKNDELYNTIQAIAAEAQISNILEIGSSSGSGSTEAFVKGIRKNPKKPLLYCMEVSEVRFSVLQQTYSYADFVKCYNLSSIDIDDFPSEEDVINFYRKHKTNLNNYPLDEVIRWLHQDIDYVKSSSVSGNGIRKIKEENNIDYFDLVLIDGSEFTGNIELDEVYGAKIIILDDINSLKNYEAHHRLLDDENYILVRKNFELRNGYSIFKKKGVGFIFYELPIHFFTIVLNGQPFIEYHIDIFKQLPFKWQWHIVEGVAELKHDTGWSVSLGGKVTDVMHYQGRSKDGTTEYIDKLAQQYPNNITVYRKPEGIFWDGKREMVNAPLVNISEECLLWQVDVDELWTFEQICKVQQMFIEHPEKSAAFYWCWYFVGEKLIISTRNCHTQNPKQEWLRTWRFKPGYIWAAHEPPKLVETLINGKTKDIASINPFLHKETEKQGLVFHHYAYVIPQQLKFKEIYYGYKNAESQWLKLQTQGRFPLFLSEYFAWVKDKTMVDMAESCGVVPIAKQEPSSNNWYFLSSEEIQQAASKIQNISPIIAIDGVVFQLFQTGGIPTVWKCLLAEWVNSGFAKQIVFLDRDGTAPIIPGIRYCQISRYKYSKTATDSEMLQKICDQQRIQLLVSTYYTTPISTPSVFMAYDMIPEVINANLNESMWKEKHYGILHACAYVAISENTARDLLRFFPHISPDSVKVAHCGLAENFQVMSCEKITQFRTKYNLNKPYFLLVGARIGLDGYKNARYSFQGFSKLPNQNDFAIVCVGSNTQLEPEMANLVPDISTYMLKLSDEELKAAYSGAVALVYPSLYEGFGLPILEAMACGCPVITCRNSSIPEVGGEAVLYVSEYNIDELVSALSKVQHPDIRSSLVSAGLEQAKKFSWSKMAETVAEVLMQTAQNIQKQNISAIPSLWEEFRSLQAQLQNLQYQLQQGANPVKSISQNPVESISQSPYSAQLQQALALIDAMETSKFWKLRTGWFKLKKFLGLPVDFFESQVNFSQPSNIQLEQAYATIAAMRSSKFWKLRILWFRFKSSVGLPIDE
ncbi:glycosyltransferase [Nostoc sp. KVJ3]|uniref:glycosyltransferase family 4 protein n=1 Tax=Nostoc sp. KVJ3 TaxID=457945 RepID=UPI0022386369|nr:glycosyltransferase family 1 protein [Nostoc sp. KVJ3]MCW5314786.1 glycosyltransferase [Nostoc sp. KVJ3]